MIGRTVLRASGKRRVKNRVDACRYVLEMWDDWRGVVVPDIDEMEEERREREKGSGLAAVTVGLLSEAV